MIEYKIEESFSDQAWSMKMNVDELTQEIIGIIAEASNLIRDGKYVRAKANLIAAGELCSSVAKERELILEQVMKHLEIDSSYVFQI